jgi:hypothetical protein
MPKKKEKKFDADFYTKEIGVLEWLKSNEPQVLRFVNRIEYKLNNEYHREDGPAIEFFDGIGNQFFVSGKKYDVDEWTNFRRTKLIDEMTNKK